MPKSKSHRKKRQPKRVLALPDLEQAKAAVLRYLGCKQKLRVAVNDRLGIEPDAA